MTKLLDGRQVFHQTTLAAGSVVLVDDALLGSLIQRADRFESGGFCFFSIFLVHCNAGFGHEGSGFATIDAVADSPSFVLFVAFYCRLDVSQLDNSYK